LIKAILYDLDGVLVDACEWHYLSLNAALLEVSGFEISLDEHLMSFNGLPTHTKLDKLVEMGRVNWIHKERIWKLKQDKTLDIIQANAKEDLVKQELHRYIREQGIKIACVTNSITETAAAMLESTGQIDLIDLLVSNQMVKKPKPHGEGYIRAMVALNSLPEETLIVEDSPVGLEAARTTGAYIWQVKDSSEVTLDNFKAVWSTL